jgi:sugar phosphate isomerase/epimerase
MITRRSFIHQTATLAAVALGVSAGHAQRRYKMGLQLFTINRNMNQDPVGSLKRIAGMGYQEVETYGIDPGKLTYYGMPARELAQRLKDLNLTTPSGHYDLQDFLKSSADDLNRYVDQCAEGAHLLGQTYVTWPTLGPGSRPLDVYKVVAERLNLIGARLAKAKLQLAYHNNNGDFVEQDGQVGYDIILKETDPKLVKLQVDVYWLVHDAKQPPHYWFTRAPGRFEMWHVKDLHKVSRNYTELGNGTIDYTKIWPDAAMSGMKHFFVEQGGNFAVDAMTSAEVGAAYVKQFLLK